MKLGKEFERGFEPKKALGKAAKIQKLIQEFRYIK